VTVSACRARRPTFFFADRHPAPFDSARGDEMARDCGRKLPGIQTGGGTATLAVMAIVHCT
jgi:hypothetical protein